MSNVCFRNTACLSTFVKIGLYNSEEKHAVYISVLFKKSATYLIWKDKIVLQAPF